LDLGRARARPGGAVQPAQPLERREAPRLLAAGEGREVADVERADLLGAGLGRDQNGCAHPTAPSICSSMSRLSSNAYSMGSSLAIGSMKPRTIIAIASSSVRPRDIR